MPSIRNCECVIPHNTRQWANKIFQRHQLNYHHLHVADSDKHRYAATCDRCASGSMTITLIRIVKPARNKWKYKQMITYYFIAACFVMLRTRSNAAYCIRSGENKTILFAGLESKRRDDKQSVMTHRRHQ